jgi:hypothetical protein
MAEEGNLKEAEYVALGACPWGQYDTGEGGDVEANADVCLRSGLQAPVLLSPRGDTAAAVFVVTQVGGRGAKFADSEGGGVERSRAGDNKDKSAKDRWC